MSTSQVVGYVLFDILLIVFAARIVGGLFVRWGQPRVVGEIVAGIVLGPTVLGMTPPDMNLFEWLGCADSQVTTVTECLFPPQARTVIGSIGQLGLLLFTFLVGLEIDLGHARERKRGILLVGVGVTLVPILTGLIIAPFLSSETYRQQGASDAGYALFLGAMLAVTALPVLVRILEDQRLTRSSVGVVATASGAVGTTAMFMAASVATSLASGESLPGIAADLGLMLVYIFAMLALARPLLSRLISGMTVRPEVGSSLLAIIALVALGSGLVAHVLGLTVIVGGFLAGLVMPARPFLHRAMDLRLGDVTRTVLLPIFLAFSGLMTDFTLLPAAAIGGLALILAAAILTKWPAGAVLGRVGGLTWGEGNVLGILMNCRGLLVLVIALVGVEQGVITPVMQLGAVMMALVTTTMTGPLTKRYVGALATRPGRSEEKKV